MMNKYTIDYEMIDDDRPIRDTGRISSTNLLRDAFEDLFNCGQEVVDVEPNNRQNPRWVTVYYGLNAYGQYESRDLYFGFDLSLSSRKRIVKLMERSI